MPWREPLGTLTTVVGVAGTADRLLNKGKIGRSIWRGIKSIGGKIRDGGVSEPQGY